MVWLFVIHFGYSWGPCAWIIIAEVWPLSNRPYGISLGASSNCKCPAYHHVLFLQVASMTHERVLSPGMNNFIVGQVTPDMLNNMTYGTYIFFGLLTFGGAALYVPFPGPLIASDKLICGTASGSLCPRRRA